jgi:hypothetical protein
MVAIGLQKPYAKMKEGESLPLMMFIDLADGFDIRIKIPEIHFQDQNTEK